MRAPVAGDWLGGELSHQQMGSAVIGMNAQVAIEKRLCLLELPEPGKRFDLIEAGGPPDGPANCHGGDRSEHKHQGGQQEDRGFVRDDSSTSLAESEHLG